MQRKNAIVFTPVGFHQEVTIQFSDDSRSLVVCKKCKKNYKSRNICRKQNCHTTLPWSQTFLCVVLDESCYTTCSRENKMKYVTDRTITGRVVRGRGFEMNAANANNFDLPVCVFCKHKNYTRSYCRKQKCHRRLPWNTNYVVFSATNDRTSSGSDNKENGTRSPDSDSVTLCDDTNCGKGSIGNKESENINDIQDSRAFLLTLSQTSNAVQWLEPNPEALQSILVSTYESPSMTPYFHRAFVPGRYVYPGFFHTLHERNLPLRKDESSPQNQYRIEPNSSTHKLTSTSLIYNSYYQRHTPLRPQALYAPVGYETYMPHNQQLNGYYQPMYNNQAPCDNSQAGWHGHNMTTRAAHSSYFPPRYYGSNSCEVINGHHTFY
mmetsp:Transcript_28661/g.32951  ORF Transcript_28661/g.32951 Transcript_28661/m.32951 type:complete len:379 (-) Transcript_28661:247-1383(-)